MIAAAVEEQSAATREISRNVQMASSGAAQVGSAIVDVHQGAAETGSASGQVLSSAQSLSSQASKLKLKSTISWPLFARPRAGRGRTPVLTRV
jgi:methyl-accepting chemotaxis protein